MAREMVDPTNRASLLEMAQRWMKLALALECPVDKSENVQMKPSSAREPDIAIRHFLTWVRTARQRLISRAAR
jgi:hypothetical protein